jgi:transcriptional regulator with XRE-family HTH domain
MKRRDLTTYEKECAVRLKTLWATKKKNKGLTQEDLKLALGFKSQAAVSHYLTGAIPLNTDVKIKFAHYLNCKVADFDPEFYEIDSLTEAQRRWLDAFEKLPEPVQERLADLAFQLASSNEE